MVKLISVFSLFSLSFFYFGHFFVNIIRNHYFYKFIFETLKCSFVKYIMATCEAVNPDKINNGTVLVAMELCHSQLLRPDIKLSLHWL